MASTTDEKNKSTAMDLTDDPAKSETSPEQRVIDAERNLFRKNARFLYDLLLTHAFEWPSLTCQWLPDKVCTPGKDYSTQVTRHTFPLFSALQRLIVGTHTTGDEPNYLNFAEVRIPLEDADVITPTQTVPEAKEGYVGRPGRQVEVVQSIIHQGEVNRARFCPHNPNVVATKAPGAEVFVFDKTKHPSKPSSSAFLPDLRLRGHTKEGYGLAWSPHTSGHLLSCSDDTTVCHWDINSDPKAVDKTLQPLAVYRGHTDVVEDVAWNAFSPNLFASCGDDQRVLLFDTRAPQSAKLDFQAHTDQVNSIAFNPHLAYQLATGCNDSTVRLWDMRNVKQHVHQLGVHKGPVFGLQFSPHNSHRLASSSGDRRLIIWDLARIGQQQSAEDAADGPPELLFMHAGHKDRVADFSWNANDEWLIASVSDDNELQVWQVAQNIYGDGPVVSTPAAVELDEKNDSIMITEAPSSAKKAAASQAKSPKASKPTSPRQKPAPATPPAASSSTAPAVISMTDDGLAG